MDARLDANWPIVERGAAEQDRSLAEAYTRESYRLRSFIRRRVANPGDAEDILQEVFYELVEAGRMLRPIEQVGAWLFRVARNRITDLLRRTQTRGIEQPIGTPDDAMHDIADEAIDAWLPPAEAGPEAAYARRILLEALDDALEELPEAQRSVFVAHELEGQSFKEIAAATGIGVNTLLARKRYAVLHLRRRLQAIHDDFVE